MHSQYKWLAKTPRTQRSTMGGCQYSYARIPRIGQRFQEVFTPVSHTLHIVALSRICSGLATMEFSPTFRSMPEKPYDHIQIELKWHDRWQDATFYKAEENSAKQKFYVLEMLPYPAARSTSATSATMRLATRWLATNGCAATTFCIPWDGTLSVSPRKTPPSRTNVIRAIGHCRTSRR